MNGFTTASAMVVLSMISFPKQAIMKQNKFFTFFDTSVMQHFHHIKITTTWNAPPTAVVNSRTVNSFKNRLDTH